MKILIALVLLLSHNTYARWADPSEAVAQVNFEHLVFDIRKDGGHHLIHERQVEILKDSARTDFGLYRLNFDAHATNFRVLAAKTTNGDHVTAVPKSDIEIKALASSGPGFDQMNQVTIAFPEVAVGSKLYLKYEMDIREPQIPGLYYGFYPLG